MSDSESIRDILLKKGHTENKQFFKGSVELEEMRKIIFHYLKPYLKYKSENKSLKEKLSSELIPEKNISKFLLEKMRDDVRVLVEKFNGSDKTRQIFEKILGTNNIEPCHGFYDFRANLSKGYKLSTGWHQDCETSFIERKKYWDHFSCAAWITLTKADINNSIFIIPRKNDKFYKIYPQHYGKIGNVDYRKRDLKQIDPKISIDDVYAVEAEADECVLIDSFVLHRTIPGKTLKPRFSIDIRYYATNQKLSKKIKMHPKLYYFKLLKSKNYLKFRNSKILQPLKIAKNLLKK